LGLGLGLGLGPIHTQIGTPIEAAESVVGAVSVSESRAPAVGDGASALIRGQGVSSWAGSTAVLSAADAAGAVTAERSFGSSVESSGGGAVNVEPPVAGEYLLAEDGSVGAEEGDGVQAGRVDGVLEADVVGLAFHLGVRVVTSKDEPVAGEAGLLHGGVDGVVGQGLSRYSVPEPVERVVSLLFYRQARG